MPTCYLAERNACLCPVGSGLCVEGEDLAIDWGEGLPAPQAVMELLSCDCKKERVQDSCTCIQNGLKCTNLCKLTSCANRPLEDDDDTTDLYNDSDDSDDDDESDDSETEDSY